MLRLWAAFFLEYGCSNSCPYFSLLDKIVCELVDDKFGSFCCNDRWFNYVLSEWRLTGALCGTWALLGSVLIMFLEIDKEFLFTDYGI